MNRSRRQALDLLEQVRDVADQPAQAALWRLACAPERERRVQLRNLGRAAERQVDAWVRGGADPARRKALTARARDVLAAFPEGQQKWLTHCADTAPQPGRDHGTVAG